MPENNTKMNLEAENADLKAQVKVLSTLNTELYSGIENADDEIDLRELWQAIWQGKWLIIAITFIFALSSVLYALSLPNEYKSTVLLAPASSSSSSSLSKLAGQFGGLASLAGLNLGAGGADNKTVIAMEIIKTWGFIEKFIEDNQIEVEVFAAKGWNRMNDKLIINQDLYDENKKIWVRKFDISKNQKAAPSTWELFKKIENKINITQDRKSGLISLSVEHFSPTVAKEWADKLVKAINDHIQKRDRDEAMKNIEYLNDKIKETNIADMQSVFYQLIEEQTKTLMLAEVSEEYVFKTLSSAKVAEEKSKPKRAIIVILGVILGALLSLIFVLIRHFGRSLKE